jgi:transcriptional regulator with XRE-family HTH domain
MAVNLPLDFDDIGALGAAVRSLRKDTGWTQAGLAEAAGISRDPVTRLERGGDVSLSTALAIIRALGHRGRLEPRGQLRAADVRRLFAHVHEEADE